MTPVEEIKSKLAIEDIVGESVTLKRAGTNFKGLCPFHQEKTPSFMVSPDRQIWHCFGCGEGGDLFSFVQKYEGIEFREALQLLGEKAGVAVGSYTPQDSSKRNILLDIHRDAQEWYMKQLWSENEDATKTRDYLKRRSMEKEIVKEWGLGFAPDSWDGLLQHLDKKGYSYDDIIAAGLAIKRDGNMYDRFRRRLMFPIRNPQGNVIAFTARTLVGIVFDGEEQGGKYINSPQTQIYNKSAALYGFDKARQDIRRLDYAIVVEGNTDVIMSHQVGIRNVVAASGTALTLDQLQLLKRYSENIILSFDSDNAGSQAVFKGITIAWDLGMNIKVIVLDEGSDPADVIKENPATWKKAIKQSYGVVDYYFDQVFKRIDVSRADHKKAAAVKITGIISKLKTKVEQSHYIQLLSRKLDIQEPILWEMVGVPVEIQAEVDPLEPKKEKKVSAALLSEHALSFIITYPKFLETFIDSVEPEMIFEDFQDLYKRIIIHYTHNHETTLRDITADFAQDLMKQWSELVFRGEQLYISLTKQEQEQEIHHLITRLKSDYFVKRLHELTEAIRRAEIERDTDLVSDLMHQYQELSRQRNQLHE